MRVSYWLLPAEPAKSELQRLVSDLAARCNAPVFVPHVTLYSGALSAQDRPDEALAQIAGRFAPLELQVTGISYSPRFTQTLFMEFAADEELALLSAAFKAAASEPFEYELKPHLSLVYASLDEELKKRLKAEIRVPTVVRFDAIAAMTSGDTTCSRSDVEKWKVSGPSCLAGKK